MVKERELKCDRKQRSRSLGPYLLDLVISFDLFWVDILDKVFPDARLVRRGPAIHAAWLPPSPPPSCCPPLRSGPPSTHSYPNFPVGEGKTASEGLLILCRVMTGTLNSLIRCVVSHIGIEKHFIPRKGYLEVEVALGKVKQS